MRVWGWVLMVKLATHLYIYKESLSVCLLVRDALSPYNSYGYRTIYDTSRGPEEGRYLLCCQEKMH